MRTAWARFNDEWSRFAGCGPRRDRERSAVVSPEDSGPKQPPFVRSCAKATLEREASRRPRVSPCLARGPDHERAGAHCLAKDTA
jgi:hypothetical protein